MTSTYAIRIEQAGGPEKLQWSEVDVPAPQPGQVQLRNLVCGVNYIDVYHRTGSAPEMPTGLGIEACAVVEALGDGVTGLQVGDRVAHGTGPLGAYSLRRNFPADKLVKVPAGISDAVAAAMMLKGMTVEYLIHRTYAVEKGDWVLLHAAAGGVGSIASQWLSRLGARVIGTAGSPEKMALAREQGCEDVVSYRDGDWARQVKAITGGAGVSVVYDGVGKDVFLPSLDCLRPRGYMINIGSSSGPAPEIAPGLLAQKGSLFLTRPSVAAYTATRAELELSAGRVIEAVQKGWVNIKVDHTYALADAAQAHRDLEARKTTGAVILLPR